MIAAYIPPDRPWTWAASVNALRAAYVAEVLAFTGGDVTEAAKIAGVDRGTLYKWMRELAMLESLSTFRKTGAVRPPVLSSYTVPDKAPLRNKRP